MIYYDFIKQLSVSDLAKFIYENFNTENLCKYCIHKKKCKPNNSCKRGIMQWLKSDIGTI